MSKLWTGFLVAGLISTLTAVPSHGIEMFTFFGDGSRIGLPSLEVPIEAYRGIPLRSDRIRARNRAMQAGRRQPGGITIRRDPTLQAMPQPTPRQVPHPMPEPR